jgi:hypothetical protein
MRRVAPYRISDMRIGALPARIPPRLAFWALAGVALFLSHDTIFLVQVGPGEALARTLREAAHGYWEWASLVLAFVGLGAAFGAWLRLRSLRRRAARLGAAAHHATKIGLPATWLRLLAVVAAGFLVQENVEHYLGHMHAPGLAVLFGVEYPLALPVIALISGAAALLATAVGGVERGLLAAIAAALGRGFGRAPRNLGRPPLRVAAVRLATMARANAGRAPPRAFAQHC